MSERCWILTDGATGNVKQCEALAHYLELDGVRLDVGLRAPWSWFAPRLRYRPEAGLRGTLAARLGATGPTEWPDFVIAAGRRAALAALAVRRRAGSRTYAVQILDPRIDPAHFDLVICPRHDPAHGRNVLKTRGSLHAVDAATLAVWRERWAAPLGGLPCPRAALLIGAPTRPVPFDATYLDHLVEAAARAVDHRGSLLVTTSRRTPEALRAAVRSRLAALSGVRAVHAEHFHENPYPGFLAWADHLFVTPDSVNMLSEALGTGAPVYTTPPEGTRGRLRAFFDWAAADGLIQPLEAAPAAAQHRPLRETGAVAAEVRRRREAARARPGAAT